VDTRKAVEPVAWARISAGSPKDHFFWSGIEETYGAPEDGEFDLEDGERIEPLYSCQPGWLTAKERRALERAFDLLCDDDGDNSFAVVVQAMLARNSAPVVERPECPYEDDPETLDFTLSIGWEACAEAYEEAISKAGVETCRKSE
jgi:hypothetical protein